MEPVDQTIAKSAKRFAPVFCFRLAFFAIVPILGYNSKVASVALIGYTLFGIRILASLRGAKEAFPSVVKAIEFVSGDTLFRSELEELNEVVQGQDRGPLQEFASDLKDPEVNDISNQSSAKKEKKKEVLW